MQQDMTTGFYTISVLEGGEGALDPLSTSTMEQVRYILFYFLQQQQQQYFFCLCPRQLCERLCMFGSRRARDRSPDRSPLSSGLTNENGKRMHADFFLWNFSPHKQGLWRFRSPFF